MLRGQARWFRRDLRHQRTPITDSVLIAFKTSWSFVCLSGLAIPEVADGSGGNVRTLADHRSADTSDHHRLQNTGPGHSTFPVPDLVRCRPSIAVPRLERRPDPSSNGDSENRSVAPCTDLSATRAAENDTGMRMLATSSAGHVTRPFCDNEMSPGHSALI